MPDTINQFSQAFGQGQRSTLFKITGNIPNANTSEQERVFFIKSGQYPASTIGFIEVPFKGRKIKRPGDRTFAEWSLTVLQDEKNNIREDFIGWMNSLNRHVAITGGIELFNCFPTEVGSLEFNYETVDTFAEFTVTLQYDYWTSKKTDN